MNRAIALRLAASNKRRKAERAAENPFMRAMREKMLSDDPPVPGEFYWYEPKTDTLIRQSDNAEMDMLRVARW